MGFHTKAILDILLYALYWHFHYFLPKDALTIVLFLAKEAVIQDLLFYTKDIKTNGHLDIMFQSLD